ncbi:MAG: hypothetical protein JWP97_6245 [Labilithrix sp.]|nr:hypothetical protein [Labilithrix sp.]
MFGIEQSKAADGSLQTTVGYEYLDLLNHGWNTVGLVGRSASCYAERLDERIGRAHAEGGVATFQGGALPDKGIAVLANNDDLVMPAAAWRTGGAPLTFAAKGFAMPEISPATVYAPEADLTLTSPADAAAEVTLDVKNKTPVTITWDVTAPTDGPRESVVASFVAIPPGTTGQRGAELRCFFDRQKGSGTFPDELVEYFGELVGTGSEPVKGTLHIATHRQLTIYADGGWVVYVVATADQREQPFTLVR